MVRPSRTALSADDPTYLWKAILRLVAILLAGVGIGTAAWALTKSIDNPDSANWDSSDYQSYDNHFAYDYDYTTLPWTFITLGLSILWNGANLIVLLARNRPIHPGANVGCDLVLWLALIVTGTAAVIGSTGYFYYVPGQYNTGYNSDNSYRTFTNSSGTYYQLPDGSLVDESTAQNCGGFTTCAAEQAYADTLQRKGIVTAVSAGCSFIVLLIHLALFISACRYTHARRYAAGSNRARAITAEATQIAQQMIAEMTGPNGAFRPRSRQQESQPLMGGVGAMQLKGEYLGEGQSTLQHYPSAQSSILNLPPPDLPQRRYEDRAAVSPVEESSSGVERRAVTPEIRVEGSGHVQSALKGGGA